MAAGTGSSQPMEIPKVRSETLLPDCRLSLALTGQIPPHAARRLARAVADAAGRYLRGGGCLGDVDAEASRIQLGRVLLMPPAAGGGDRQRPRRVQADLESLWHMYPHFVSGPRQSMTFLLRLAKAMDGRDGTIWARLWIRERQREHLRDVRDQHAVALREHPPRRGEGLAGTWSPEPALPLPVLQSSLRGLAAEPKHALHQSRRSEIFQGTLLGEEVVVKQYRLPARPWTYRWQPSRARRAWAAATVMRNLGLPCPVPLGFLEIHHGGIPCESLFISRPLAGARNARALIKPHAHRWPAEERSRVRHELRALILDLGKHGLYHRDTKLSNLLARREEDGAFRWWWIDLEDIRAGHRPRLWELIRIFMQLNGSMGGHLSDAEREKFAAGFHVWHRAATHPLLLRYVALRTRIRLARELRRECKP